MVRFYYARALRKYWKTALSIMVLAIAVAVLYTALVSPTYTSRASFYISAQVGDSASAAYQGGLLTNQRIGTYADLLRSDRVAADTNSLAHTGLSDDEVASRITASSRSGSVVLEVAVTDTDAARAEAIASGVVQVFPNLVAELERPATPGAIVPIAVRVIEQPVTAEDANPKPYMRNVLLGLIVGLLLGLGIALARGSLDRTVHNVSELKNILSSPCIGQIPYSQELAKASSSTYFGRVSEDPVYLEAFKQVRTNLQFVQAERRRHTLLFSSSVPGEGKTTVAINTASALAAAGYGVCLVEADLRRPSFGDYLGIEQQVGLTTVLSERASIGGAIQRVDSAFDVLASGQRPPNPSELVSSERMAHLLHGLQERYDYVLVDAPPILPVADSVAMSGLVDGLVLVCRANKTNATQVRESVRVLEEANIVPMASLLTMVDRSTRGGSYGTYDYSPSAASLQDTAGKSSKPTPANPQPCGADDTTESYPSPYRRQSRSR